MAVEHDSHWQSFIALEKADDTEELSACAPEAEIPACPVLLLRLFAQQPTLDFGPVAVNSRKTMYMRAENPTLLNQHLAAEKIPVQEGFSLSEDAELPGAASLNWSSSVAPHSNILLPVTWQPSAPGPMSKLLVFKLDGKHRLQVKILGKAVPEGKQAKQIGDQALRQSVRRTGSGIDAPAATNSHAPAGKAAGSSNNGHTSQPRAMAAEGAPVRAQAGSSAGTAEAGPAAQPDARFKVPPRPSIKSMSGLRLKAPTAAVPASRAASANGTAPRPTTTNGAVHRPATFNGTAQRPATLNNAVQRPATVNGVMPKPTRPTSASLEASKSTALLSPTSPPGSLAVSQLAGELSSPALLGGSVRSFSTTGRPLGKGAINRSGRPLSGSSSGGSARKVPSSARKTFKFYHTELWMNKQDRAFTGWLNHLLLPYTQEYLRAASEGDTSAALSDLRLAARVQGAMLACYRNDAELRDTMMKIETAIDANKLRMKPEVVLFEDLVQRQQALQVLMGYNPFWLTLAVEVVTHKPFRPQETAPGCGPGTPGMKRQQGYNESMKAFLMREVLSDPDMVADLEAGRGAAHFNMDDYLRHLGALVLKRFLLLVMLLDRAATDLTGALRTPLLFKLDAPVKDSAKVVFEFLHGRLVGEGQIVKHLQLLGYKLAYAQSPLMEYPFAVTNLAVDLRDGLRLIKVAEALTGDCALLGKARYPADRRPMQVHNTNLALEALKQAGVPLSALPTTSAIVALKPEDIVDGDRERTLSLLWAIARTLQLGAVLKVNTLKAEVQRVLARTRQIGIRPLVTAVAGLEDRQQVSGREQPMLHVYLQDDFINALMEWVQAVSKSYGVAVRNFTGCFDDGVVLCLLVHYYLPNAIDLTGVYLTKQRKQELTGNSRRLTDDTADGEDQATSELGTELGLQSLYSSIRNNSQVWGLSSGLADSVANSTASGMNRGRSWRAEFDVNDFMEDPALEDSRGIAGNYKAVHRAAKALGAVPEMLSSKDHAEHGPDERAVILYVAFLCSRLLDCSKDDRAAHVIQTAWRRHKSKLAGAARAHLNTWVTAASIIQSSVRAWLLRRRLLEMVKEHRAAAMILQSCWRGRLVRLQQQRQQQASVVIQRYWRSWVAHRQAQQQQAALVIQRCWRNYKLQQADAWMADFLNRCLEACLELKQARQERSVAVIKLQATWRMVLAQRQLLKASAAAVRLQAAWRGRQQRLRYKQLHRAAVAVQAAWRGYQQRQQYLATLIAAVTLQAAYQGLKVRTAIKQSHAFAVFLQSCCRCRRDRAAFLRLRTAAVVLQAGVRGWQARQSLQQLQQACVVVQALWRGRAVRCRIAQQHTSATAIQAVWRGSKAREAYQQHRAAAVRIQAAWRCFADRRAYQQQQAAALALQSCFRGKQVRAQIQQQAAAVTAIAAAWRAKMAARQFAEQLAYLVQLQALVRGHSVQQGYQQQRAAVVTIQSVYRGWTVRQQLQKQHQAALVVQSWWKGHVQQQSYISAVAAATSLQAAIRGHQARSQYHSWQAAAALLQSSWRAKQCRALLQQHKAAAVIQSHWRRLCAQRQLQKAVKAVVVIQSCWRCHKLQLLRAEAVAAATTIQAAVRKHQALCGYQALQAAAVYLQSSWRSQQSWLQLRQHRAARLIQCCWKQHKAMQQLQQHKAARSIQSCWRRHKAIQQLQHHRAARTIQCSWRRYTAMHQLRTAVAAAIRIQAQYRQQLAQQAYQQMLAAAVAIQAMVRGRNAAAALQAQQQAAVVMQNSWRAYAARKVLQQNRAAACIQAHVRGWLVRKELARQAAAATVIRAAWVCHKQRQQYLNVRAAVVLLQAHARGAAARKQLSIENAAAVLIQAHWRGLHCRQHCARQHSAAATIQAAYRAHQQRQQYLALSAAVVLLQAHVRAAAVRKQLGIERAAAVLIQAHWRGLHCRQQYAQQHSAAATIQAAYRAHQQRQQYLAQRAAVVLLQAHVRAAAVRKQFAAQNAAAVLIQAHWRGLQCRQHCAQQHAAAITIQAAYKAYMQQQQYLQQLSAAVTLQSVIRAHQVQQQLSKWHAAAAKVQAVYRGWRVRQQLQQQRAAATSIQAAWRSHRQQQNYQAARQAVIKLQTSWRSYQAATKYQQVRQAAVALQAAIRGQQARGLLQLQQLTAAAVMLQSMWRGRVVRQEFARQSAAVVVIQRFARGMLGRKRAKAKRDYIRSAQELQNMLLMLRTRSRAATTIAAAWRGYRQRQRFTPVWRAYQHLKAAVVLQQAWRCRQARVLLHKLQEELPRRKARVAWRTIISAAQQALWQQQHEAAAREAAVLVIQSAVRGWQVRKITARQIAGIKRLQALWRGYKVRKSCGRAGRDARRRIAAAVSAPPRRTIGVRTREALDVLLASKQCSQVITAVAAIEFSTRYSKACCQLMVDSEGIRALLEFMRSCNRSKPHMEMLGHALACLANICRWPDLLPGVLHAPECIMVLSERLQMFRDTEDIFLATVGILSSLVRSDEGALAVAQSAPTAVKLWEQINLLLQRKMEMERKYIERLEGQKGSDVTAREATRKLVSAATQVDALQQVIERVDHLAAAYGIEVVHHQTQAKPALPAAETPGQELVPRSAHVVVQPNLWQPKNTIVRGTFRETVATRAGTNAAAAASVAKGVGSSSAAAAVADITNVVAALQQLPAEQHKSDQLHKQHRLH